MKLQDKLYELSIEIEKKFDLHYNRYEEDHDFFFEGWSDKFWRSDIIRKCHLKVIDNRDKTGLWLMHINVYPSVKTDIPILGCDIVSGPKKITGVFFDVSPVVDHYEHTLSRLFREKVQDLKWSRERDLPGWAKKIFSKNMIAAGNVRDDNEVDLLCNTILEVIDFYTENEEYIYQRGSSIKDSHNFYCQQQKINPHLHRSITAMGITDERKDSYINQILFEEI